MANFYSSCFPPSLFRANDAPQVLWIGCADSRVPESVITACKPGDIFVHRNIAKYVIGLSFTAYADIVHSQFHLDDDSALSVLTYAVEVVGVEHVVIVGHTQCGGAIACYDAAQAAPSSSDTPLSRWLTPLTKLASNLQSQSPEGGVPLLVEENVKAQVEKLCQAGPVVNAWQGEKKKPLWVHGWVYEIEHGKLKDLEISKGPQ